MEPLPAPSAYTLPTAAQPLRVAEFDALFGGFLTGLDRVDATTLDLRFRAEAGLDRTVEDLAARESSCRSFSPSPLTGPTG